MESPTNGVSPVFTQHHQQVPIAIQEAVFGELLQQNESLTPETAFELVDKYFKAGFSSTYFNYTTAQGIAKHISATMLTKKIQAFTPNQKDLAVSITGEDKSRFEYISHVPAKVLGTEKGLVADFAKVPNTTNISLAISTTDMESPESLYLYTQNEFVDTPYTPQQCDGVTDVTDVELSAVCSKVFLQNKSAELLTRYSTAVNAAAKITQFAPVVQVYDVEAATNTIPVVISYKNSNTTYTAEFLPLITQLLFNNNLFATRKFLETFKNNVAVFTIYIKQTEGVAAALAAFVEEFKLLSVLPTTAISVKNTFLTGGMGANTYAYALTASKAIFYILLAKNNDYAKLQQAVKGDRQALAHLRSLFTNMRREAISHDRINQVLVKYPVVLEALAKDFKTRQTTPIATHVDNAKDIKTVIARHVINAFDAQVFEYLYHFNKSVAKTNFYMTTKAAVAFRLLPTFFQDLDLPALPFGVFFVVGGDFQGFHVRFSDVSRGGIRLVMSRDEQVYAKNVAGQFEESFNLAFTQNLKNKDIPEFGSKGTVLLNPGSQTEGIVSFKRYIASLLDVIITEGNTEMVDNYSKPEILFLGPDEGTAGVMKWAALYAKQRGYNYWRAFTTGKPSSLGGIPHDVFGMTTNSVHQYVLGTLAKMNLDETTVTKVQTGGPDGDLGSNEILISKDKTVLIIDGSGVLCDPEGIDREEMTRLAKSRIMSEHFDKSKLSTKGFFVHVNDVDVVLPDGTEVPSGVAFRNEAHLSQYATADLFVPCGGRPAAVNLSNVQQLFKEDGTPKFKYIIEGANLFFTPEARDVLEEAGIVLYKDASSNKGGVTSSSLEVLAALALEPEVFEANMACSDPKNPPQVYSDYVQEILQRIRNDAAAEFACVWNEWERKNGTIKRHILTDLVSDKINQINYRIVAATDLFEGHQDFKDAVLKAILPKTLQQLVGFDKLVQTIPPSYLLASISAALAAKAVYKYGYELDVDALFDLTSDKSFKTVF